MESSHEFFARKGDPWVTPEDWKREEKLAADPMANTRQRESAIAFTKRASMTRRRAEAKPAFSDPPRPRSDPSERAMAMARERENLKLMLSGLGACERTIKPADLGNFPKTAERNPRLVEMTVQDLEHKLAEPTVYPNPKPLVSPEEVRAKRRGHDLWLKEELEQALAAVNRRLEK